MAELKAYNPTLRDRLSWALGDAVGILGGGNQAQRTASNKARGILDFLPVVGDAVSFDDARVNYNQGNYGQAAADAGMGILGSVPGAGDAAVLGGKGLLAAMGAGVAKTGILDEATKGIRAYHGSPHSFDKFSMDKIGTGEGAQAYGHGLYFAENEQVAKDYRDALKFKAAGGSETENIANELLDSWRGDFAGALDDAKYYDNSKAIIAELKKLQANPPAGHMYEVNINADPDAFLDWDAPLQNQPASIQDMARNADLSHLKPGNRTRTMLEWFKEGREQPHNLATGQTLHNALSDYGANANPELSNRLKELGFPGIKYQDAGSRGAEGGTRNYVVFDENLISIVKKYGLAGAVSAGLISQQMADQMQAQGEI